jgi:hypothetical protein
VDPFDLSRTISADRFLEASSAGQFAALKTEIGLTERYGIEGWRVGRELEGSTTPSDQGRPCPSVAE